MKADPKIIAALNTVLANELVTINQTFLHARMCRNAGFKVLNDRFYHESIHAMKRADKLIERVLFLEGLPNLQQLGRLRIGEEATEMLNCDHLLYVDNLADLRSSIVTCESLQDYVSRDMLTDLLEDEEEYLDWLETQQELITHVGKENYLQAQAFDQ
ncbi:bacterioferritin [Salinispirillum sp. LH 10-3-1]|uniref:Bacterioferritin n=1 Tax=Salinispirillum sp. LH 10-3-1 TaxID=2952525 RepID=A0AB38YG59_9GAMM